MAKKKDEVLFSGEYVSGKEGKPSKEELKEITKSIDSFSKEPRYEKKLGDEGLFYTTEKEKKGKRPPKEGDLGYYNKDQPGYSSELEKGDVELIPLGRGDVLGPARKEEIIDKENLFKDKYGYPGQRIVEGTYRRVSNVNPVETVIGAKGYLSEKKLKLEASRYGITGSDFENFKNQGKLAIVKNIIDTGKSRELARKKDEAFINRSEAATRGIESSTTKRYAEVARIEAQVPKGGRRLVQFGTTNFGNAPIYLNAGNTHSSIRERYTPSTASGVQNSIQNSRFVLAQLRQNVVGGGYGVGNPKVTIVVSRLAGKNNGPTLGPSVLQKLSNFRRR